MKYLVDSNVLSEPTKDRPEPKVMKWLAAHRDQICTSILVFGEIERGIDKLNHTKRAQRLEAWYRDLSGALSAEQRVLGVDMAVISRWAAVYNREERLMKRRPQIIESLLAATADLHGLTLVSRNKKDFSSAISILNPWE